MIKKKKWLRKKERKKEGGWKVHEGERETKILGNLKKESEGIVIVCTGGSASASMTMLMQL